MAFRGARHSKFKHVFGTPYKKDKCYDNIRISKSLSVSNICDVNGKFLAVIVETQGDADFIAIPLTQTGRLGVNTPKVCGHKGPVLSVAFNPFNDNIIASSSEDCTVKIWKIPDEGLTSNIELPIMDLQGHQSKVTAIGWHPTAVNVIASAGADGKIFVYNTDTGDVMITLDDLHNGEQIYSMSWNYDGSMLATSCKDRYIRTIDPRKGTVISEAVIHDGSKPSQVAFCGSLNYVFTTGFNRRGQRCYALCHPNNFDNPLCHEEIDQANGVNLIHFDEGTKMVYLVGKGDSFIRYYKIMPESPYVQFLSMYNTSTPQIAACSMPKRFLNFSENEIARFYKLHGKGLVEPITMTVPRKSEMFQSDIYPPCYAGEPVLIPKEWMSGVDKPPALVEITKDGIKKDVTGKTIQSTKNDIEKRSLQARVQELESQMEHMKKELESQMEHMKKELESQMEPMKKELDNMNAELHKIKELL